MRFAHMADCHIGGWRDPRLKDLNTEAFFRAIDKSVLEKVDFILISGDLFNSALPGIDRLKDVVKRFRELKDKEIPVYIIPGSHDFSPSGKTMLDVLEEAGLCINVVKGTVHEGRLRLRFTVDAKTGAKITGMLGKRGMLERAFYEELDRESLESEDGFKIFMFHTAITELKQKGMERMESSPVSLLPKGFDYYAGGHVHIVENMNLPGYKKIVYPGPLFPNNFHELEELKGGGFYIYDDGRIARHDIMLKKVVSLNIDADHRIPEKVTADILGKIEENEIDGSLVMIRVSGTLSEGKSSDVDFRRIYEILLEKGAYFVMRNTSQLSSREFEEVRVDASSAEEIETSLIHEHAGSIKSPWPPDKEQDMIKRLMDVLSAAKKDGEKVYQFEERIGEELNRLLGI